MIVEILNRMHRNRTSLVKSGELGCHICFRRLSVLGIEGHV